MRTLRLIDSCITQLKAQGPARTYDESKEEEEEEKYLMGLKGLALTHPRGLSLFVFFFITL